MATPTILDKDSAKLPSGNLPISSAVIASTTPTFFLLISIAFFKLDLIPVTTTSSTAASSAFSSSSCARRLLEKGNIIKTWSNVRVKDHVKNVIEELSSI